MAINVFAEKQKNYGATGFKELIANKIGVTRGIYVAPKGKLTFATNAAALTLANWQTLSKASRVNRGYMIPLFDAIEDKSTDDVFSDGLQGQKFNQYGKIAFTGMMDINMYLYRELVGFNGKELECVIFDESASITGRSSDDIKFQGIPATIHVGKPKLAAQGEKQMYPITVTLKDTTDIVYSGSVIEPLFAADEWNPLTDLDGVYNVDLTATDTLATGTVITVKKRSVSGDMAQSSVSGLVKDDFVQRGSNGVTKTITTVTE